MSSNENSETAYSVTVETYESKYKSGYGLLYPDGHVIRFHRHILQYELGITDGKILDYGCGTGTHLLYFKRNGFTPYGCDISPTAISTCRRRMPAYRDNFHVIPPLPNLRRLFPPSFDVVFSNQVLYYLDDADLRNIVGQFHDILAKGGIVFVTMMAPTNYYSRFVVGKEDGLSKVTLTGRLNETTYINFKTKEQILRLFEAEGFSKLHLGFYGSTIREDEGPTDHYIYVGRK